MTLARLGKDDLKEALWDELQRPASLTPLEWSRHLGAIAYELLWRLAPYLGPRLIIEAPIAPKLNDDRIRELHPVPIEVFLWAQPEVVYERCRSAGRANTPAISLTPCRRSTR